MNITYWVSDKKTKSESPRLSASVLKNTLPFLLTYMTFCNQISQISHSWILPWLACVQYSLQIFILFIIYSLTTQSSYSSFKEAGTSFQHVYNSHFLKDEYYHCLTCDNKYHANAQSLINKLQTFFKYNRLLQ